MPKAPLVLKICLPKAPLVLKICLKRRRQQGSKRRLIKIIGEGTRGPKFYPSFGRFWFHLKKGQTVRGRNKRVCPQARTGPKESKEPRANKTTPLRPKSYISPSTGDLTPVAEGGSCTLAGSLAKRPLNAKKFAPPYFVFVDKLKTDGRKGRKRRTIERTAGKVLLFLLLLVGAFATEESGAGYYRDVYESHDEAPYRAAPWRGGWEEEGPIDIDTESDAETEPAEEVQREAPEESCWPEILEEVVVEGGAGIENPNLLEVEPDPHPGKTACETHGGNYEPPGSGGGGKNPFLAFLGLQNLLWTIWWSIPCPRARNQN
jgi:hypothetical protein